MALSDYALSYGWTPIVGIAVAITFGVVATEFREMARVTLFGSRNTSSGTGAAFDAARDIPSLAGKVVLITGAAGDLGRQAAIELARYGRPARIYIADLPRDDAAKKEVVNIINNEAFGNGADSEKLDASASRPKIHFLDLDLASFESVRACAAEFVANNQRLDILLLNAGIIRVRSGATMEGYESHFGINYLGHALLSRLLSPIMLRTSQQPGADVRIVAMSSEGHAMAPKGGIRFDKLKTDCADMSYAQRYGQSKLALIAFARELADRLPGIKIATVHPGRILTGMATGLWKESFLLGLTKPIAPLFCVSASVGVLNTLWTVTSSEVVSGTYYEPVGVPGKESIAARDRVLSRKLWEWAEQELQSVEDLE